MKKTRVVFFLLLAALVVENPAAQDFSRIIEMRRQRMNGPDVARLQRQLLFLGFKKTGAADGWYGPLTEGSVKTLQYYMGFPQDGKVTRSLWNVLFDPREEGTLRNIGILAARNEGAMISTVKRNGTNADFDEWTIAAEKDEVKTVLFRHVNEGLIIFRFKLYYLADAVFMIQDVYYGDYRRRVYLKTAEGFFELKNGGRVNADAAMEGIFTRTKEEIAGISGAGLKAPPPLVPNFGAPQTLPPSPGAPAESRQAASPPGKDTAGPPAEQPPARPGTDPVSAEPPPASSATPAGPPPVMTPTPKNPTPISP